MKVTLTSPQGSVAEVQGRSINSTLELLRSDAEIYRIDCGKNEIECDNKAILNLTKHAGKLLVFKY